MYLVLSLKLGAIAKSWLEDRMPKREKWVLAFDAGGLRYGMMTNDSSKSFNKVFKGIRVVPVLGIVEYSFWNSLNTLSIDGT